MIDGLGQTTDPLTRVRSTESGWSDTEIAYDGDGNRIWKKDSGGQTYYDWDEGGLRCLRQKDGRGFQQNPRFDNL